MVGAIDKKVQCMLLMPISGGCAAVAQNPSSQVLSEFMVMLSKGGQKKVLILIMSVSDSIDVMVSIQILTLFP